MPRTRPILLAAALLIASACGDGETATSETTSPPTDSASNDVSDASRVAEAKGTNDPANITTGLGTVEECPPTKASCPSGDPAPANGTRDRNVPTGASTPTQPPTTLPLAPPPAPTIAPTPTFDPASTGSDESPDDSGGPPAAVSEQVFRDYLLAAGAGRFDEAWQLLTSGYQDEYGGDENFVDFWSGIALVGINSISARPGDGETILDVVLFYETLDGVRQNEHVQVTVIDQGAGPLIADYVFIEVVE